MPHDVESEAMRSLRRLCAVLLFVPHQQLVAQDASWLTPFPAFRIAGNLYYVGSQGLASYLITSPQGHILINSGPEANVSHIQRSVESLGFKFRDIRVLLISHAHWDHAAGSALVKRVTGARFMVMRGDDSVMESGGKMDFHYGSPTKSDYPPVRVDRVLRDGDTVSVGSNALVARLTPGHTKGCTTWTMRLPVEGRVYHVVIVGSPNVNPGYPLVDNRAYPMIARDFARTFNVLRSLKGEIFLGAHGSFFDLESKYERWRQGDADAFVDPTGYQHFVNDRARAFRAELDRQLRAARERRTSQTPRSSGARTVDGGTI